MRSILHERGLPYCATQDELAEWHSTREIMTSANRKCVNFTGQSRGFGFVEMSSQEEATAAIEALNSTEFGGRSFGDKRRSRF